MPRSVGGPRVLGGDQRIQNCMRMKNLSQEERIMISMRITGERLPCHTTLYKLQVLSGGGFHERTLQGSD